MATIRHDKRACLHNETDPYNYHDNWNYEFCKFWAI